MIIIKPYYEIEGEINGEKILRHIERAARTCYKSEHNIGDFKNTKKFIKKLIVSGHEASIEHYSFSVRFIIDRGISHEIVRMRLCSFSQESTRYVNYQKKGIEFILPPWVTDIPLGEYDLNEKDFIDVYPKEYEKRLTMLPEIDRKQAVWLLALLKSERYYNYLISNGWKPQEARSVLPNSLKTEIVVTANIREWRHIFKLRTSLSSHPQMREIMCPLLNDLKNKIPIFFEDIVT